MQTEIPIFRRQGDLDNFVHQPLAGHAITDKVLHRNDLEIELICELSQFGHPRHRAVFVHYFAQNGDWLEAAHSRQIYSSFCMSRSAKHAFIDRTQWENV